MGDIITAGLEPPGVGWMGGWMEEGGGIGQRRKSRQAGKRCRRLKAADEDYHLKKSSPGSEGERWDDPDFSSPQEEVISPTQPPFTTPASGRETSGSPGSGYKQ